MGPVSEQSLRLLTWKATKGLGGAAWGAGRQPALVRLLLFGTSGSAPFDGSRDRMKRRFREQHGGHQHLPWVLDGATATVPSSEPTHSSFRVHRGMPPIAETDLSNLPGDGEVV